jgi:glycosyltransferase involved in cell wall biosynthesis
MYDTLPLLSIVIPTRNRFDYATFSIQSVLGILSPLLQLAVEDNSDDDKLDNWVRKNISDRRLVYHHSKARVSMSTNYDNALDLATGEYVSLIGDDDGVNPEIIAATKWAKHNEYDAIVPSSVINYVWPDLNMESRGAMKAGELRVLHFTGKKTFPDPEIEMRKCVCDAGQVFHKLPKAYYGIVRKKCMDKVKQKTGTYFPGISPDMAAALSVANFTKRICHVDYPLFVPGSSANSNAGLSGLNKHIGRLCDQPHLPATCEDNWSKIVPAFYSVQTIWAEAAVSSLRAMGREDILKLFNVPKLFALCYIFHRRYLNLRIFYQALRSASTNCLFGTLQLFYYFGCWYKLQIKIFIKRLLFKRNFDYVYTERGVQNIDDAVKAVKLFLEKDGKLFDEFT